MAIRLNTNVAALDTLIYLNRHYQRAQNSIEHLSSGLRIMRAADDPAYLGISVRLRVDSLGFQQSAKNANDGVTFVQLADAGASEVTDVLTKMRTTALAAANGTLDSAGRSALTSAFSALKSEVQRIINTSKFGDIFLLKTTNSTGGTGSTAPIATNLKLPSVQFALGPGAEQMMPFNFTYGISSVEFSIRQAGGNASLLSGTVTSISSARSVINSVDAAVRSLAFFRSHLGGTQDALSVSAKADENIGFNVTSALSHVRDLDFAAEVANFTQANILQQAATAMLAQANLINQSVLQLLS